jgi:hypothetical protein
VDDGSSRAVEIRRCSDKRLGEVIQRGCRHRAVTFAARWKPSAVRIMYRALGHALAASPSWLRDCH